MPMTKVEEALSKAADAFETACEDPATRVEMQALFNAGQKPHVLRSLRGLPGCAVLVMAGKEEHLLDATS